MVTPHVGIGAPVAAIQLLGPSIKGVVVIILIQLQMVMDNTDGDRLGRVGGRQSTGQGYVSRYLMGKRMRTNQSRYLMGKNEDKSV